MRGRPTERDGPAVGRRRWVLAGVALVTGAAALYVLTSPGRIDMIDGQFRFEAGMNLLVLGRPTLDDPALHFLGVPAGEGRAYARYGVGSTVAAAPLLALGFLVDGTDGEVARFLFSLASPLYGAVALGLLLLFYRKLGAPLKRGVGWALVLAFGTLWWPLAVSSFGQVQHGLLLLLALYGAWRGAVEGRWALLVLGGLAGGLLINYVESYALLLPAVGLAALAPGRDGEPWRPRMVRYLVFGTACAAGLAAWMGFNLWRFGDPLFTGRGGTGAGLREGIFGFSTFDNPLEGLLSLLVSPGKGILLYSLPVIVTVWGARRLAERAPWVALATLVTTVLHVGLVSSLSFHGGDWAWGPRYLVVLLPLWALTWPLVAPGRLPTAVVGLVVGTGVVVQLLAVSIDHQRFFFERNHEPFFWLEDWIYFKESALLARPGEISASLAEGVPDEARRFSPTPYPDATTYAIFGPNATNEGAREWMRHFQVFYLPRPWPFWTVRLPEDRRPFDPVLPVLILGVVGVVAGTGLIMAVRTVPGDADRGAGRVA